MKNDKINFVIDTLHALKYFIPLTIEGNKNGLKSIYYVFRNNKWHSITNNMDVLNELSELHNFDVMDGHEIEDINGNVFCLEGAAFRSILC